MDECLIACKTEDIMVTFKKELRTRFVGTDEGEVTQYLGYKLIRDRKVRTGKLVQSGYADRVLKTFVMWNSKSPSTPGVEGSSTPLEFPVRPFPSVEG